MRGDTDTHCHCGCPYAGSDHCPDCGCEQFESGDCGHTYGKDVGNMSYPLTTKDKLDAAESNGSGFFLTRDEVKAVNYDLRILREANRDFSQEHDVLHERIEAALAQARGAEDRAHEFEGALKFANDTNAGLLAQIENLEQRLVASRKQYRLEKVKVAELVNDRDMDRASLAKLHTERDMALAVGCTEWDIAGRWGL
jgi:hypothetical protein